MANSPRQRLKNRLRATDRRGAPALHRQQGGRCFWCGAKVVIARLVAKTRRRALNHETLTLTNGSQLLVATVDHLDGVLFRSPEKRLVVSCYPCNWARESTRQQFIEFLRSRCQSLGCKLSKRIRSLIERMAEKDAA